MFPVVPVESISAPGLTVAVEDWALLAAQAGLDATVTRVSGQLRLRRKDVHIFVEGQVTIEASRRCDRCGASRSVRHALTLATLYSPVSTFLERDDPDAEGDFPLPVQFDTSIEDQGEYDGVALDLREVVRESAALERPIRLLCADVEPADDAACNARWRKLAGSAVEAPPSPFAVLQSLKLDSKLDN